MLGGASRLTDLKLIFAENLIRLRTGQGMTQAELGEMIRYSDKSVSKWERAESLPDAYVLKNLSKIFGVSVDQLLSTPEELADTAPSLSPPPSPKKEPRLPRYNRFSITQAILAGIWTLATLIFIVLLLCLNRAVWLVFAYTMPVSLIVWLVLNSIWGNARTNLYLISGLVWSLLAAFYLSFAQNNWWQIFLPGIPAQLLIIFCFRIAKR